MTNAILQEKRPLCNKRVVLAFLLAGAFASMVSADTFYWYYEWKGSPWAAFTNPDSWRVGDRPTATNPDNRTPSSEDDIHCGYKENWSRTEQRMDMQGGSFSVRNLIGFNEDGKPRNLYLRNGGLTYTGSFTNYAYQIEVLDTGRFSLASTCASKFGMGGTSASIQIDGGGIVDLGGTIAMDGLLVTVLPGGTLNVEPGIFTAGDWYTNVSRFDNDGTVNLTRGFDFGGSGRQDIPIASLEFHQKSGTLNLGGDFKDSSQRVGVSFFLSGGTVNVTENAAFVSASADPAVLCTSQMTDDGSATVNVAAGKTFDIGQMTFGERTALIKTGAGTIRFGASLPATMSVNAGTVEYAGEYANLGSSLTLASGTTLCLAASGISASAIAGLDEASVTVSEALLSESCVLFSSPNMDLLSAMAEKLQASGVTGFSILGGAIVWEKAHDASVFSWKDEGVGDTLYPFAETATVTFANLKCPWHRFFEPESWVIGTSTTGSNSDGLIPGENDGIYVSASYFPIFAMDMQGAYRKVRNLELDLDSNGEYPNQWGFRGIFIRNGVLEFTGSFTNVRTVVKAKANSRFVLGRTSFSRLGLGGAEDHFRAENGGEIGLLGTIDAHCLSMSVEAGGKMVIDPVKFTMSPKDNQTSTLLNGGTLELPNGLDFVSGGWGGINTSFVFENADGSTINLGGSVVKRPGFFVEVNFTLGNCTLNVTNRVAFTGLDSLTVADGATVTINVPKGSSIDLSEMSFGENTTVDKYGYGRVVFGADRPDVYNNHGQLGMKVILR